MYMLLIPGVLHGIYIQVKEYKKNGLYHSWIKMIILIALVLPFVEESVFRHTLKDLMSNVPYAWYINSLLFGLLHLTNKWVVGNHEYLWFQAFYATVFGYVCYHKHYMTSYFIHGLSNFTIISMSMLIYKWLIEDEIVKEKKEICIYQQCRDDYHYKHRGHYKFIPYHKIKPDMITRIEQLKK